jgi:hypothetical protein
MLTFWGDGRFGPRFALTGQLPTAALVLFVGLLIESGAPGAAPDLQLLPERLKNLSATEVIVLAAAIVGLAIILQPLQLGIVRTLEGYPLVNGPGAALGRRLVAFQARRWQQTKNKTASEGNTPRDKAKRSAAAMRLLRLPAKDRLMPTMLGNVLRAGEDRPRARYGMDAVLLWPHVHALLRPGMAAPVDDQRDQLDATTRMSATLFVGAAVSFGLLVTHGWWLAVPAALLVLSLVAYRSAIAAGVAYATVVNAAIDLHRFDLLRALHLELPRDLEAERRQWKQIGDFLTLPKTPLLGYDHDTSRAAHASGSGALAAEGTTEQANLGDRRLDKPPSRDRS